MTQDSFLFQWTLFSVAHIPRLYRLPAHRLKRPRNFNTFFQRSTVILNILSAILYSSVCTAFNHLMSAPVFLLATVTRNFFVFHDIIPISASHPYFRGMMLFFFCFLMWMRYIPRIGSTIIFACHDDFFWRFNRKDCFLFIKLNITLQNNPDRLIISAAKHIQMIEHLMQILNISPILILRAQVRSIAPIIHWSILYKSFHHPASHFSGIYQLYILPS